MTWSALTAFERIGTAAAVASAALALAACGSSGPSNSSVTGASASSQAGSHAYSGTAGHRAIRGQDAVHRSGVVARGQDAVHRAGGTVRAHGRDNEVGGTGAAFVVHPCSLVSAREVQSLTGRPVARSVEAPLGPTCVYQSHGRARGRDVTLTVSAISFRAASRKLSSVISLKVAGHAAYCGVFGTPVAYVSLAQGRVMTIGAPCPVAAAMAKTALTRL